MGNFSLALVLVTTIIILTALHFVGRTTRDTDDEVNVYLDKTFARESAVTGLNLTLGELARDTTSWAAAPGDYGFTSETYRSTTFDVEVQTNYGPTVRTGKCNIDSVDVIADAISADIEHTIEATIVRTCLDKGSTPGKKISIVSEQQFLINGETAVFSSDATQNASIHSNEELYVNGDPTIEGYGTYTGSYWCDPDPCVGFDPNDDINGSDPNVHYSDSVEIPTFVAADHLSSATYVETADVILDGESGEVAIDFTNYQGITGYGTAENPFIWYLQGGLEVKGDIRFIGFGMIVVTEHVHINSDAMILSSIAAGAPDPPPTTVTDPNKDAVRQWIADNIVDDIGLGIYVEGSKDDKPDEAGIHIDGNATIAGHLFANHKVHVNGDATVFGGIVTKRNMHMNGKNVTWYTGLNEGVNIWGTNVILPNGIRLIAYSEW